MRSLWCNTGLGLATCAVIACRRAFAIAANEQQITFVLEFDNFHFRSGVFFFCLFVFHSGLFWVIGYSETISSGTRPWPWVCH